MPIYWSPSSKTALAEAELEYNSEHRSQSIYVRLPLTSPPDQLRSYMRAGETANIVIWTTTPWTLPANKAVCYSPGLQYCLLRLAGRSELLILAESLLETVADKLNTSLDIVSTFSGGSLAGLSYHHPIYEGKRCPLLPAEHVTSDVGTGLVHTAPAHGHDDFKVALKHGLSKECMVDGNGKYTLEAGEEFEAKHVFDEGNSIVQQRLGERLLYSEEYIHKYPYDWRSKQPVIIRASRQWFIDTKKLIGPALKALEGVEVSPPVYKSPLCESISQRPYWCISRQRAWGVPIPVFQDEHGNSYVHRAITDHLRQLIINHGPDIWWEADDTTLLPDHIRHESGIASDLKLTRGRDILDIWFDSGVTWSSVLGDRPADLYIEGVDQIRGWFQSSLLTCVAINGRAPYKSIMMHGFTVDEEGQKMSKSLGNVVAPSDVIYGDKGKKKPGYGVDVLRWWAASKYAVTNVDIGPNMIRQCNDKMLQLRKRMRFILGNVYDFVPEKNLIDYNSLLPQDQYFLHVAHEYANQVTSCYESNDLSAVLKWLELFTAKFSNIYATLSKDRLYCFPADSRERRSAQTVLHHTFNILVYSAAPILPFFAEDCFVHRYGTQLNKGLSTSVSIFRSGWMTVDSRWQNHQLSVRFEIVFTIVEKIRSLLNNTPADTMDVMLVADTKENKTLDILKGLQEDAEYGVLCSHSPLCEAIQCASVSVATAEDCPGFPMFTEPDHVGDMLELGMKVYLKKAAHMRCQRCRRYTAATVTEPCEMCLLNMANTWTN
ncbi:isoleucine--tRNA ligase, mitochondrial-like isoform X2 [Watersipora subatra]